MKTSDAGSQYRCGRVGRGIQALFTPQPTSNTQTYTKSIENAHFQLDHHDGRTDRRTDRRTNRQTNGQTNDGQTKPLIEEMKVIIDPLFESLSISNHKLTSMFQIDAYISSVLNLIGDFVMNAEDSNYLRSDFESDIVQFYGCKLRKDVEPYHERLLEACKVSEHVLPFHR